MRAYNQMSTRGLCLVKVEMGLMQFPLGDSSLVKVTCNAVEFSLAERQSSRDEFLLT